MQLVKITEFVGNPAKLAEAKARVERQHLLARLTAELGTARRFPNVERHARSSTLSAEEILQPDAHGQRTAIHAVRVRGLSPFPGDQRGLLKTSQPGELADV